MKKISILFLALGSVAFLSCKDNSKTSEPEVVTVDNSAETTEIYAVADTDAEFKDSKVETVFKQYLQVENALINTDAEKTASEADKLKTAMEQQGVEANDEVKEAVRTMAETDDIAIQREKFQPLSDWMEESLQGALKSGTIYKQYCPMAFDNTGAYWLSTSKEVLNPYFGDKMLKCGRVETEIVSTN